MMVLDGIAGSSRERMDLSVRGLDEFDFAFDWRQKKCHAFTIDSEERVSLQAWPFGSPAVRLVKIGISRMEFRRFLSSCAVWVLLCRGTKLSKFERLAGYVISLEWNFPKSYNMRMYW